MHRKFTNAIVIGQKFDFQILYLHRLKIKIWVENWKLNRGTILTLHLMPLQKILEIFLVMSWAMSFHTVRIGQKHLNILYAYICKALWCLVSVSFRWWVNSSGWLLYELFLLNIFSITKRKYYFCRSLQKFFCIPLMRIMYFYADRYFYIPHESLCIYIETMLLFK